MSEEKKTEFVYVSDPLFIDYADKRQIRVAPHRTRFLASGKVLDKVSVRVGWRNADGFKTDAYNANLELPNDLQPEHFDQLKDFYFKALADLQSANDKESQLE
jgi:hypothetical protein